MSVSSPIAAARRADRFRTPLAAVAALVGSAACWGLATVMSKSALGHLPPFALLVTQLTASVAFLWSAVALTRAPVPLDAGGRRAALSGVLEPGLSYAAGSSGLALTGAAHASLIGATEPLFIVLIAWAAFSDRPAWTTLGAVAVAVLGVIFVTVEGGGREANSLLGDGLIALGAAFAAFYVLITSRLSARIEPAPLAALQQSVGLAFAALLAIGVFVYGLERLEPWSVPASIWLLAIVSGVVQYALAFWLYLFGLRRLPVGSAAMYLALIPVFGVSGAALFLGERLTGTQAFGCLLVVGALIAASKTYRKEPHD